MTHASAATPEIPVTFDCEGQCLVGIVHKPANPASYGVLSLVAGGPQYRAGVGRGLVNMGRFLSSRGVAMMRFDHRGLGDGTGEFLGFEFVEEDLKAAIRQFKETVPEIEGVVLWGGCDAASAILTLACRLPDVRSIAVGNPFVSSEETQAVVRRQHYLRRLTEFSFWKKVFSGGYNPLSSVVGKTRASQADSTDRSAKTTAPRKSDNYIANMLAGFQSFDRDVLFVMSGQSLTSREFDALLNRSGPWQKAYARPTIQRIDLPDADQGFSSKEDKIAVNGAILHWVQSLPVED